MGCVARELKHAKPLVEPFHAILELSSPLCDRYKECALSCLFNTSRSLCICLVSCTSKPKHLSPNLSCNVWNTALQIGTQLGVKVNGSDLQNRDLQLLHLLWQPWHHKILCTKKQLFKEGGRKKAKGNKKMFYFRTAQCWLYKLSLDICSMIHIHR